MTRPADTVAAFEWSEAVKTKMLNDIINVPRSHAGVGFVPLTVRYEAACAALAVLVAWHDEDC